MNGFFDEIIERHFGPAIGAYPAAGGELVERLLALSDLADRLTPSRRAAVVWGRTEARNARITSEFFVITQQGLVYGAGMHRRLYYLATPPALFEKFVDEVDAAQREGTVVAVDGRLGRDLAAAHPMDAALRHILDEHLALRVGLPV
ncbi:glucose-6-phosphate dehydrogenase [Mycobacterium hubeiense]|uniref:glucose-6-phosphate dehydrogenase n=1 Tax=Mycobacterium hubeiense TaxID=1867256 RepID=UPI001E4BAA29|nr:glucose-6-phosphate dehydrogenase [Mycobacterium sp. QGD 101]